MASRLRDALDRGETVVAPGVGDALTAKLVEQSGFGYVSMSGYQVSANLGYPDVGLVTLSEMVYQATRIASSVQLPVIADADTGHGNVVNVRRTIEEFERAGVAAVHLEDQVSPKKCGHTGQQELVPTREMCGKVHAALNSRKDSNFLIVARCDAMEVGGIEDTIARSREYKAAGADALMFIGAKSPDDLKRFRDAVAGPLVVTAGSWFDISNAQYRELGYQLILYPLTTMRTGIAAIRAALGRLQSTGFFDHSASDVVPMHDLHHLLGMDGIREWERRFG